MCIIKFGRELETREFYHQDLMCQDSIRPNCDGEIFFIDSTPGMTDGMYQQQHETAMRQMQRTGCRFWRRRCGSYGVRMLPRVKTNWNALYVRKSDELYLIA